MQAQTARGDRHARLMLDERPGDVSSGWRVHRTVVRLPVADG